MPILPQVDAGPGALHPSETGIEATAGAARRVGMFYNQRAGAEEQLARETERLGAQTAELGTYKGNLITGEGARAGSAVAAAGDAAVKIADHQQISHGAVAYTGLLQNLTDNWNSTVKNADPNDTTLASRFMASMEPQLSDFKSAMWTEGAQQWAEAHADALRKHFAEKTSADMSTLAGQAAIVNTQQTVNSLSNTVHDDPTSIGFALASLKSITEAHIATSPNITGPEAARIREEITQKGSESIVKSAAIGYISRTGQVPDWVTDPKYSPYVNGQELQLFARQARVQQHYEVTMQKQATLLQKQLDEQAVHAAANKNFSDNVTFDPATNRASIKPEFFQNTLDMVRRYPDAPNAASVAKTYLDWGESQQREQKPIDNPATTDALLKTISDPNLSVADAKLAILKSDTASPMTPRTRENLLQIATDMRAINDPLLIRDMEAAKELIEPKYGGVNINPGGYAKFYYDFIHNQYMPKKIEGTLPPNALDFNDPNSMISQAIIKATGGPKATLPAAVSTNGGVGAPSPLPVYTAPAATMPKILTKDAYDKLMEGTTFIGADGKQYTKPKRSNATTLQPGQM